MSDRFDVAVVGAGMFGSAAGKYLSQQGLKVLIIGPEEPANVAKADYTSFGAYFDEARICRRLGWDNTWGALDSLSLNRFREIETLSGIDFFHECGSLILMAGSIEQRTSTMLAQTDNSSIAVERCDAEYLLKEFEELAHPPLSGGIVGLLERKTAGYLNPRRLVEAQLGLASQVGGKLVRAAVTKIAKKSRSDAWQLSIREESSTNQTEIHAARILIATGAFTNHNGLLPETSQLALQAFAEPNLLIELNESDAEKLRLLPPIVTVDPEDNGNDNVSIYLIPPIRYPDGKVYMRIGPGMQPFVQELETVTDMTTWYRSQQVTDYQGRLLEKLFRMLLPNIEPLSIRHAACIIEKTPSRYPYLGALQDDSLFVVVGGNGHGARGSDEIGRLASLLVSNAEWDSSIDRSLFAPIFTNEVHRTSERPKFLKPPFGLC